MNRKGITLIELIVVIVIIAFGAVLMVPSIGAWLPYYRLKSGARDIASIMRVAQMKAVSNNLRYHVSFDKDNNNYILQYQTTGGALVNDGEAQTLPKGVTFNTTFAGNIATFFTNSTASKGDVILTNTRGAQRIIQLLGTTGRIRIE